LQTKRGFLSLGSNLGDRMENMKKAIAALSDYAEIEVKRVSRVYEAAPMGKTNQPNFLNLALEIETRLSARQLLRVVKEIEKRLGRAEGPRWGPRIIDIDILLLGEERVKEEDLCIPHSRLLERAFFMVPLAELEPNLILGGERASRIAARLAKEQKVNAAFSL